MVKASKGTRSRTRHMMSKPPRKRGLNSIARCFQKFEVGDKANIIIDPAMHKGQPYKRFHGQTGEIIGKRGAAYILSVQEKGKLKTTIARPEHLKKSKL
ncbi:MAG TPA: 50S ribosomal protein L21e [Thermoplasmata archaeon]|nr:50S ribosomal protein L21e [Thermoplasmata archaeon]